MAKKLSISRLKKKAWDLFSQYVRRERADYDGNVSCVACGARKHWKQMQASHLVAGRRLGILFDKRGVFPCCVGCNVFKGGNYREYDAFMDEQFGRTYRIELVEELRRLSKQPTKWTRDQFQEVIETYQHLLDGMGK